MRTRVGIVGAGSASLMLGQRMRRFDRADD
jgi:hypothetical protein